MAMFDPRYPVFGLYFRRYAPWAFFGGLNPYTAGFGNFAGDNRGVSTSLKVTSRTYGCVMFNRFGIGHSFAGSSGTHFHPALGDVIIGMSKTKHTVVRSTLAGPDLFSFRASTAGNNPLVKPSPDINTFVNAEINFGVSNKLTIRGEAFGDHFPNLEVFLVCYRSSRTALLLDGRARGGKDMGPVLGLLGSHESHSLGKFSALLNLDQKGELSSNSSVGSIELEKYTIP